MHTQLLRAYLVTASGTELLGLLFPCCEYAMALARFARRAGLRTVLSFAPEPGPAVVSDVLSLTTEDAARDDLPTYRVQL